jgi:hypothetical protein
VVHWSHIKKSSSIDKHKQSAPQYIVEYNTYVLFVRFFLNLNVYCMERMPVRIFASTVLLSCIVLMYFFNVPMSLTGSG